MLETRNRRWTRKSSRTSWSRGTASRRPGPRATGSPESVCPQETYWRSFDSFSHRAKVKPPRWKFDWHSPLLSQSPHFWLKDVFLPLLLFVFSVHLTRCSKIRTAAPSFRGDHCPFFTPNGRYWFSTQAPSVPIFLNLCDPYVKLCSISPTWEGTPPYSIHSLVREPHIDSEKVTNFRQNSQGCLTIFPNIH